MVEGFYQAPNALRVGAVVLLVRDIDRMIDFYQGFLGLQILETFDGLYMLGFEPDRPLILLRHKPDAAERPENSAGLYHMALLCEGRPQLARALDRLVRSGYPLQGAADHFVSEAIYLADPEGNGIEIYADRPRASWNWDGNQVRMGTLPLDVTSLLELARDNDEDAAALSTGTVIGHIHLQVTDLDQAMAFYERILGFALMAIYGPSAAFFAAGGYHHHIGVNTWASARGPRSMPGLRGLIGYELVIPTKRQVEDLRQHLLNREIPFRNAGDLQLEDPSGNRILIQSEQAGFDLARWSEFSN